MSFTNQSGATKTLQLLQQPQERHWQVSHLAWVVVRIWPYSKDLMNGTSFFVESASRWYGNPNCKMRFVWVVMLSGAIKCRLHRVSLLHRHMYWVLTVIRHRISPRSQQACIKGPTWAAHHHLCHGTHQSWKLSWRSWCCKLCGICLGSSFPSCSFLSPWRLLSEI